MKRRDFVKIAALLPVAPAMVVASQLKPAESPGEQLENAGTNCAYTDNMLCSHTQRHGSTYWVTFDGVKKQTNFLRAHLGNKGDFWYNDKEYFRKFNVVSSVETLRFIGEDYQTVTNIDFDRSGWVSVWLGAKISINVVDHSIRIEQKYQGPANVAPRSSEMLDWKWTHETYKETVVRVARELRALNPSADWLVSLARAENVPQTEIEDWMRRTPHVLLGRRTYCGCAINIERIPHETT